MELLRERIRKLFVRGGVAGRIPELDGLKAFSVLMVVLFHVFWMLGDFLTPLNLDLILLQPGMPLLLNSNGLIDLFFIIAAFLNAIALIKLFEGRKFSAGSYAFQRIARFIPVLLIAIAFYALAGMKNIGSCWSNLFFINNFFMYQDQCMEWSWYLSVQEQYMLLAAPGLVFLLYRFPRVAWWLMGITAILGVFWIRLAIVESNNVTLPVPFHALFGQRDFSRFFSLLYAVPHTRMLPLILGSILGWAFVQTRAFEYVGSIRMRWSIPVVIAVCIFVLPGYALISPHHGTWDVAMGQMNLASLRHSTSFLFAGFLLLLLGKNVLVKPFQYLLASRVWHPVSELSLLIYLLHPTVIFLLYRATAPEKPGFGALLLYFLAAVIITFALSVITYILVERPCRDWIRKKSKQRDVQATAQ